MGGSFCFCQLYRHAGKWRTDCFGGNIPVFRNIPDQHNGIISFFQFDGFESICGNGTAYFVEDLTSKKKALASLMNQMSQKKAFEENSFAEAMVNAVTVWKIVTENVTGKRHE